MLRQLSTSRSHVLSFLYVLSVSHITQLPLVPQLHQFHQSRVPRTNSNPIQVLFQYLYYPIYKVRNTYSLFFLSLKRSSIFKLLIRGMLCPILIQCLSLFLMPFIRSLASKYHAYTIASIISLGGLMPFYSYYTKKGLIYVIIANFFTY